MSSLTDITSAEFIRYNANAAGHSSPDCVKRALSLAFDIPYNEIAKELLAEMKRQRQTKWNISSVYQEVVKRHGGSERIKMDGDMQLADFADTTGNRGTWLVTTGSKPGGPSNHIVCVIDGTIYDSWDSTKEWVIHYQDIPEAPVRHFTEINISDYRDEIDQVTSEIGTQLISKYPWYEYLREFDMNLTQRGTEKYRVRLSFILKLKPRPYLDATSQYTFEFFIVFTPSTTDEEAHKIIRNTIKTRLYDRLYSINQTEKKKEEALEFGGARRPDYLDQREIRFWNTLPARVQAIVKYIRINEPGQYHDSYEVEVTPQWGEKTYSGGVWLETYQADEMRELLDLYIKDGTTDLEY